MAFVEAIAGELVHQIKYIFGLVAIDVISDGAFDEACTLRVHFGLDLFTHGPAQQIGVTQTIARHHLGDLHDLFLVDNHPIGLSQNFLQAGVQIVGRLTAGFDVAEFWNVIHRAGTVQGHHGDDVFKAIRPHLAQGVAHARAFKLENTNCLAVGDQIVGRGIVQGYAVEIKLRHPGADHIHGPVQHGQSFQAQKIKLHQARRLHPFHVELGHRHVRIWVAV